MVKGILIGLVLGLFIGLCVYLFIRSNFYFGA